MTVANHSRTGYPDVGLVRVLVTIPFVFSWSVFSCSEANFKAFFPAIPASNDDGTGRILSADSPKATPETSREEAGSTVRECRKEASLPKKVTALKEAFNWHAQGDTSEYNQVIAAPAVGKLLPSDPNPTIIAVAFHQNCDYTAGGAYVYAIDGKTGQQRWVSNFRVVPELSAAIGDVDLDGENEVIVIDMGSRVRALDKNGGVKWTSSVQVRDDSDGGGWRFWHGGLAIADLDLDGDVEIVTQTYVLDGKTGEDVFSFTNTGARNVVIANIDGDKGYEIVSQSAVFKADGSKLCDLPKTIELHAAAPLKKGSTKATIIGRHEDSVVAMSYDGTVCELLFTTPFPGGGGGSFNIADYDGDGINEFGAAGRTFFATFDALGNLLWKKDVKDFSSRSTGATTFDFNGDGKNEIVYNDHDFLRVYDGLSGRTLYQTENSSGTLWEYPLVVDADSDGHANIVVHANSCFAYTNQSAYGIRVFEAPANDWVGSRSIWNQHAYNPLLVNDDGSLINVDPEKIYKPWLESPHLVGMRNNIAKAAIKTKCK